MQGKFGRYGITDGLGMYGIEQGSAATPAVTYATWNPADKASSITLSTGNLIATGDGSTLFSGVRSTISKASGKWYWEYTISTFVGGVNVMSIGVANASAGLNSSYVGMDSNGWGWYNDGTSSIIRNNNASLDTPAGYVQTDIISIAMDMDGKTVSWYKNNILIYTTGAILSGSIFPMISNYAIASVTANFGATPFTYSVPSGYNAGLYA